MIPQLADGEGHDLERLARLDRQWLFELDCIAKLIAARAECRKVSFKAPVGISHIEDLAHD